jgi:hypothetical protein
MRPCYPPGLLSAALLLILASSRLAAQTVSNFNGNNENWTGTGDVVSAVATWVPTGGNPGGYIRLDDLDIGGTWYFQAPAKFHGDYCDAYATILSYDQFVDDTSGHSFYGSRPDLIIEGANGTVLIFEHFYNPGLTWTHFEVPLIETAPGWHVNDLFGPAPTEAEFRAVLADITDLRIRGEYRTGPDYSGLDNVMLEPWLVFDADEDDSTSPAASVDFYADTVCITPFPIVDSDPLLDAHAAPDSLVIEIAQTPGTAETLEAGTLPLTLTVAGAGTARLVLYNTTGQATLADFRAALLAITYEANASPPAPGLRQVDLTVYLNCRDRTVRAFLPLFAGGSAGSDGMTTVCAGSDPVALLPLLGPDAQPGGTWTPAPSLGVSFDPAVDLPGTYRYMLPPGPGCAPDTSVLEIAIQPGFAFGSDTIACRDSLVVLDADGPGFTFWTWSTGATTPSIAVTDAGTYAVTVTAGECSFVDSIAIERVTCADCRWYVPNVIAPDGEFDNAGFRAYPSCTPITYRLLIFDRWGSQVFESHALEDRWDGTHRGRRVDPGVFVWYIVAEHEAFGQVVRQLLKGDVTVLY